MYVVIFEYNHKTYFFKGLKIESKVERRSKRKLFNTKIAALGYLINVSNTKKFIRGLTKKEGSNSNQILYRINI